MGSEQHIYVLDLQRMLANQWQVPAFAASNITFRDCFPSVR